MVSRQAYVFRRSGIGDRLRAGMVPSLRHELRGVVWDSAKLDSGPLGKRGLLQKEGNRGRRDRGEGREVFLEFLAGAVALDVAADVFDVVYSEKVFAKGYVEGNELITTLDGGNPRPGAVILYAINLAFIGVAATVGLLVHHVGVGPVVVSVLVADALRHLQGGLKGRYLINGGKLPTGQTILQKIFGGWYF